MAGYSTARSRSTRQINPANAIASYQRVAEKYRHLAQENAAVWGAEHPRATSALEMAAIAERAADYERGRLAAFEAELARRTGEKVVA